MLLYCSRGAAYALGKTAFVLVLRFIRANSYPIYLPTATYTSANNLECVSNRKFMGKLLFSFPEKSLEYLIA